MLGPAKPRMAARFEIGWQPHYPDTLLFLTLGKDPNSFQKRISKTTASGKMRRGAGFTGKTRQKR